MKMNIPQRGKILRGNFGDFDFTKSFDVIERENRFSRIFFQKSALNKFKF